MTSLRDLKLIFVVSIALVILSGCGNHHSDDNSNSETGVTLISVTVSPPGSSIAKGTTQLFTATGTYSDSSSKDITSSVTWSSSSTDVATIGNAGDSFGKAVSVNVGTATITAIDPATNISGNAALTVTPAALLVLSLKPGNTTLLNSTTRKFSAAGIFTDNTSLDLTSQVAWSTSDPAIVLIDTSGTAAAVGNGTAKISATLDKIGSEAAVTVIEQGSAWTKRSASGTLRSCTWSGTQFAAVGDGGIVMTSSDGEAWSRSDSGVTDPLYGIAWSGSQFIAVGGTDLSCDIITSNDGLSWKQQAVANTRRLTDVIWTGTQFAAVGDIYFQNVLSNVIMSPDGLTWTPSFAGLPLQGIASSGSRFVAVGDYGTIITSTESGWAQYPYAPMAALHAVSWTGSRFIAVGYGGTILTSADGATWTAETSGTSSTLYGIAWSGRRLVAVGEAGTILTSPDGITWTSHSSGASDTLYGIVWSGSQFLAVGASGTILTSP